MAIRFVDRVETKPRSIFIRTLIRGITLLAPQHDCMRGWRHTGRISGACATIYRVATFLIYATDGQRLLTLQWSGHFLRCDGQGVVCSMTASDPLQPLASKLILRRASGETAMLIVFGGVPGTGKTTIARQIAARRSAAYLRIDDVEQAIRTTGVLAGDVGPAGYFVANALASSNLANRLTVVVNCVNPVKTSRQGWRGGIPTPGSDCGSCDLGWRQDGRAVSRRGGNGRCFAGSMAKTHGNTVWISVCGPGTSWRT